MPIKRSPIVRAHLLVAILVGLTACGNEQAPPSAEDKAAPPEAHRERQVVLDGQPNFRDLGGYATHDGRSVKWGQIYRSGELPRLSDSDVEQLGQLGIRTVINFLTSEEIEARGPDRLPPGVSEVSLPIGAAGQVAEASEARRTGDFSKVPADLNPEFHRMLTELARKEYAQLREKAAETLGVTPEEVDTTNMNAFYILEATYIDAALDEMVKEYGSAESYIREGLGLSDDETQRLRTELLE